MQRAIRSLALLVAAAVVSAAPVPDDSFTLAADAALLDDDALKAVVSAVAGDSAMNAQNDTRTEKEVKEDEAAHDLKSLVKNAISENMQEQAAACNKTANATGTNSTVECEADKEEPPASAEEAASGEAAQQEVAAPAPVESPEMIAARTLSDSDLIAGAAWPIAHAMARGNPAVAAKIADRLQTKPQVAVKVMKKLEKMRGQTFKEHGYAEDLDMEMKTTLDENLYKKVKKIMADQIAYEYQSHGMEIPNPNHMLKEHVKAVRDRLAEALKSGGFDKVAEAEADATLDDKSK